MADTKTTTSTLDNLLKNFYVPEALMTVYAETPLYNSPAVKKYPCPKGSGKTVYWNAWNKFDGASSTLTEGGSNDVPSHSSRRVEATIAQYARGLIITDMAQYFSVLDAIDGAKEAIQESSKITWERICHMGIFKAVYYAQNTTAKLLSAFMSSVASAFCANTGTSSTSNYQFQFPAVFGASVSRLSAVSKTAPTQSAQLSVFGLRKAVNVLEKKSIKPLADGYYYGYTHPNAIHSQRKDQAWADWNKYTNSKETLYTQEVGRIWNVRFVATAECPRYAVAAHSVLPVVILGREAVGVSHAMGGLEMFFINTPDSNNPYNTYATLTYKITGAAAALNPSAGVILWVHELI